MWNDTDIPLAYLITFRCYGTWLHGDVRGSIDRFHNIYESPYVVPNEKFEIFNKEELKSDPVSLDAKQRKIVEDAIREVCEHRKWGLYALNIRTNHVHIVVSIGNASPGSALNSFKAYATRRMRMKNLWDKTHSPWSNKGSKRYLWNEKAIEIAVNYVIDGQGRELPKFD